MSLYLTFGHIVCPLELGFITNFYKYRDCELQMFVVFFSSVFTAVEKWAGKFEATLSLNPAPMWHDGRYEKKHFWGPILS
jgi:hypothetical protein